MPSLLADQDVARLTQSSQEQALTYVMLGFFVASFIQFPIGYIVLQKQPQGHSGQQESPAASSQPSIRQVASKAPQAAAHERDLVLADAAVGSVAPAVAAQAPSLQQERRQVQQGGAVAAQQQQQHQHWLHQFWPVLLKGIFTPPVIACLMAIPVGAIPELQQQLFMPAGVCCAVPRCRAPMLAHLAVNSEGCRREPPATQCLFLLRLISYAYLNLWQL